MTTVKRKKHEHYFVQRNFAEMDFICYKCNKTFSDLNVAVKHMKYTHSITDNTNKIKCLVNFNGNDGCNREYLSFKAMKNHAVVCVKTRLLLPSNEVII